MKTESLPVGYLDFHDDLAFNFQLNRCRGVLSDADLRDRASRITTYSDWIREMLAGAREAEVREDALASAVFLRAAEFYMHPGDARKIDTSERFCAAFDSSDAARTTQRLEIPFDGGALPVLDRPAEGPQRGVLILHGGFDSFMEEFVPWADFFAEGGRRVLLFEGPGQGAALRDHGLRMTPDWERPVSAVLDHFGLECADLFGVSLGGCLAPRAAAFEPRVRRLIVCDVLDDFFDCFAAHNPALGKLLRGLNAAHLSWGVDALMNALASREPHVGWALAHGMDVSGTTRPSAFVRWLCALRTAPFADRISQDVLLLAGAEDHIVPTHQLARQAAALRSARSVTTRLFTSSEHAAAHCQVGNVGLMLDVVRGWLEVQESGQARWAG